jgi:hypothetical protein
VASPFILLALDTGMQAGWVIGDARTVPTTVMHARGSPRPTSGTYNIPPGMGLGRSLWHWRDWLWRTIKTNKVQGVIYEAPFINRKRDTIATLEVILGLSSMVNLIAYEAKLSFKRKATVGQIREHFAGSGSAGKLGAQAACDAHGWKWETPDEADALALWSYGAHLWKAENR